jgi:hypothetical protein
LLRRCGHCRVTPDNRTELQRLRKRLGFTPQENDRMQPAAEDGHI